jgi:hypothetical protein
MSKQNLNQLIEAIVDEALEEQNFPKSELASEYVKSIQRRDKKMFDSLLKQAQFSIKAVKQEEKPRHHVETIHKFLRADPDADPRTSADTHGVRLFIDHLIEQEPMPDPDLAGKAKRFYQMTIDAMLRDTYGTRQ